MTPAKTAVAISTTNKAITMIMNGQSRSVTVVDWNAPNVPVALRDFYRWKEFIAIEVAQASNGSPQAARVQCIGWTLEQIKRGTDCHSLYLLLATPNWEAPSPVGQYYGLAKSIIRKGGQVIQPGNYQEFSVSKDGLVKYSLITELREDSLSEVNSLLLHYDGVLLALAGTLDQEVLANAVEGEMCSDGSLSRGGAMSYIKREHGGFCVVASGGFDDNEIHVYAIGGGNILAAFDCESGVTH